MDTTKLCPICNNEAPLFQIKLNVQYNQCVNCHTVFSDPIDQDGMVGGEFEQERNQKENHLRIARVDEMMEGAIKETVNILDYGCGNGLLIKDFKEAGYPNTDGYDPYTKEFWRLPKHNHYDVITAIEVFEHFSFPFIELDVMFRALKPGGGIMIETGYLDAAIEDGHDLQTYFYINPAAGHSTIYSNHGMDLLMSLHGFIPRQHFNKHVKLYQKPLR